MDSTGAEILSLHNNHCEMGYTFAKDGLFSGQSGLDTKAGTNMYRRG